MMIRSFVIIGSVGGGVAVISVEGSAGGMTYSAATKLCEEINAMFAAQHMPIPCTCSMDDGVHEWNCAIEKANRERKPAPER